MADDPRVFSGRWEGAAAEALRFDNTVLSPSRDRLAFTTNRGELIVLDTASGAQTARFENTTAIPLWLSDGGSALVEATQTEARVRALPAGDVLRTLDLGGDDAVRVSADGNWLLSVGDATSRLLRTDGSGQARILPFQAHSAAVSPTGAYAAEIVSGPQGHAVRLWRTADGFNKLLQTPTPAAQNSTARPSLDVRSFRFSAEENRLVGATFDSQLVVWDIPEGTVRQQARQAGFSWGYLGAGSLSPDGLSGSFLATSLASGGWRLAEVFWNPQGIVESRDLDTLLPSWKPSQSVFVLASAAAYLFLETEPRAGDTACSPQWPCKSLSWVRAGTSPWAYKRESQDLPLSFQTAAQRVSDGQYSVSGTARLGTADFAVTGTGGGYGIRYLGEPEATPQSSPPMMDLRLELKPAAGPSVFLFARQFPTYSPNPNQPPPKFHGWLSDQNREVFFSGQYMFTLERPAP